jgi:hypothetical protein
MDAFFPLLTTSCARDGTSQLVVRPGEEAAVGRSARRAHVGGSAGRAHNCSEARRSVGVGRGDGGQPDYGEGARACGRVRRGGDR